MTENVENGRVSNNPNNIITFEEHFEEYSGNSTIHGIRYLGERKRPLVEKIWWVIVFFISITFCCVLISTLYNKWQNEPVIVSFSSEPTPLYEIPFPAVTICPSAKMYLDRFNYKEIHDILKQENVIEEISDENIYDFKTMVPICEGDADYTTLGNYSSYEYVANIFNLSKDLTNVIADCGFGDDSNANVTQLFTEILTQEGICFNFNLLQSRDIFKEHTAQHDYEFLVNREDKALHWDFDAGYSYKANEDAYPRRSIRRGIAGGLYVQLNGDESDVDNICRRDDPVGYKILIHPPNEFPDFEKHSITLQKESGILVITPEIYKMSETLRSYEPEKRKCYFTDERFLYYYKKYSERNCEQECLSNYTLSECGCVPFFLPRENSTTLCGPDKISCYYDKYLEFHSFLFQGYLLCDCLPNCNYIEYHERFIEHNLDWAGRYRNISEFTSMLYVIFDRNEITTLFRSERYGLSDFISNCGGLLGLFMGISILSFVEIFYYWTIRLICNYRAKKNDVEKQE